MAAAIMLKPTCSLLRQRLPANVVVACNAQQYSSTSEDRDVKPLRISKLSALKRGTGGRSSFNGVVATVLGATGFVGGYVINQLGKRGAQIIAPYRGDSCMARRLKLAGDLGQVLFLPFHLRDEAALSKSMKYSNVVINLIGKDNETPNFKFSEVHVDGARRIARIARESGVERLVHFSSLNVAEKPESHVIKGGSQFLASKWEGEQAVKEEFPNATIFRPADIYGQEDRFLTYYANAWRRQYSVLPLWNKGVGPVKQPVYVSDVAKAVVNAISDPGASGKIFQAVGPKQYELFELVDWFYRVMRKDEQWGYKRTNMKYDLLFWLKVFVMEKMITRVSPIICWDKIEREMVTDKVIAELPTLEDLGVLLTEIEAQAPWELEQYKAWAYYEAELGEFEAPAPPPVYSPA